MLQGTPLKGQVEATLQGTLPDAVPSLFFSPFSVFLSQLPDKFSWEHLHNKSLAQKSLLKVCFWVRLTLLVLENKIRTSGQYREADFESMQGKMFYKLNFSNIVCEKLPKNI